MRVAVAPLAHFLVLFMTIFSLFACAGFLTFGPKVGSFHSLSLSFEVLVSWLLGDFAAALEQMVVAQPEIAMVYFIAFTIVMPILLLNMQLAIIMDACKYTSRPYFHCETCVTCRLHSF